MFHAACALRLAVVEHLGQFLRSRPRVLHRIGGLPMPELLLHGRNVPRLGDDVLPHGMPGTASIMASAT
jgi:hypothetical protein